MQKRNGTLSSVMTVTTAAMLVAMSVVIGIFCKTFLNFGLGLFRITFENLPIILSGIMFGPTVGGLVGVSSDFISYLLSGQTYPLNLVVSLGACLVGVSSGMVSKYVIKKRGTLQVVLSGAVAHIIGSMIIKPIGLYQFYGLAVLWRIPLYLVIAPLEILLLCMLFKRESFRRFVDRSKEK